jgi:hypothetical protein
VTNRYRVLLPLLVHVEEGSFGQFDEFGHEFTEEDERVNVESGLLEIVPRCYRVVGGSEVHGVQPGEILTIGLLAGQEALLVAGGHIERVDDPPDETTSQARRRRTSKPIKE